MQHDTFIDFDRIDDDGPQTYSGTYDFPVADLGRDDVVAMSPVTIDVTVSPGDAQHDYLADGTVAFTADLTCSRCLDPTPFANNSPFHLRFAPRPDGPLAETDEVEIAPDELDVEFYAERTISLRELAAEQVLLAFPMKPLCDDSCLGLCAQCGGNRNREACACETSVVDERWGALAGIREELLKKKES